MTAALLKYPARPQIRMTLSIITASEQTCLILSSFASVFETPVSIFYLSFPDLYSRLRFSTYK